MYVCMPVCVCAAVGAALEHVADAAAAAVVVAAAATAGACHTVYHQPL